jgi:hypothetical protein
VGLGVVSPCVRTFQGLHSVRLWTPTISFKIFKFLNYKIPCWGKMQQKAGEDANKVRPFSISFYIH